MSNFACIIPCELKFKDDLILQSIEEKSTKDTEKLTFITMSVGRGIGNTDFMPGSNECLCYRPRRMVVCINCGFEAFGRIHYICVRHPETRFLLDWPHCPNCRGYCLSEY